MKKGIMILVLVVVLLAFVFVFPKFFNLSGNVVSDEANSNVVCNIADLNGDGEVNYLDKGKFEEFYDANYRVEDYCGYADFNEDGKADVLDSNIYAKLFEENYGVYESPCNLKKLDCMVLDEEELELPPVKEVSEIFSEKPSFWRTIVNGAKNLFGK